MSVKSSTGVKYLHKDYRDKYGNDYVVRRCYKGKYFVVWRGSDYELGKEIAKHLQWVVGEGDDVFLDWYDNYREKYLKSLGTDDGSIKSKWKKYVGKTYGVYKIIAVKGNGNTIADAKVKVQCMNCGHVKVTTFNQLKSLNYKEHKHCRYCNRKETEDE